MIMEEIRALIGTPPAGYEFLEYLFCGAFAFMLVQSVISFISGLFRLFGGDRR